MYTSIQQFIEKDIKELEKIFGEVLTGESDIDNFSEEISNRVMQLGRNLQANYYEKLDQELRESIMRKLNFNIERRNEEKEIMDITGLVRYKRTGFENKNTGDYVYLTDMILGYDPHQRITLGSAARVLEETVMSSYSRGGKRASETDAVCKQTVKNLVHETEVKMPIVALEKKKTCEFLHIVCDEDHVSAQFWNKKGDLQIGKNGRKINTIMPKLICVYEDITNESGEKSKNPRYKLIGKKYFIGVHKGDSGNEAFWKEVWEYIEATYDTDYLERIYIAGDGAAWIKMGVEVIDKAVFILDKYHMMSYMNKSVAHLDDDTAAEIKQEIWEALNKANKKDLKEAYRQILEIPTTEHKEEEIKGAFKYFINNWPGIEIRVEDAGGCWGCCAEGQVSHVLSDRLSSRPMGWSVHGCDQVAKLRAYKWNGGEVINLLKYQKKELAKKNHRKDQEDLIKELKRRHNGWSGAEQLNTYIPGLEQHSMKWMRDLIRPKLG